MVGNYPGCWPDSPQEFVNNLVLQGFLNENFPGIIVQDAIPSSQYQDRTWFRTTELQWYKFVNGNWVRPHPIPPGTNLGFIWFDTEANLWLLDGGDGNNPATVTPSDASGSFWQANHAVDGRFLVAPGTVPGAVVYNTTTPITIAENGAVVDSNNQAGEYAHTLLEKEMPSHQHLEFKNVSGSSGPGNYPMGSRSDGNYSIGYQTLECDIGLSSHTGGDINNANVTVPANNLPPFYSAYFVKRTARKYIIAT